MIELLVEPILQKVPAYFYLIHFSRLFAQQRHGVGVLGQWAVTPSWVLSGDVSIGSNYHPWTFINLPVYDVGVFYQKANLGTKVWWQAGVASDYKMTSSLHGLLGVKHLDNGTGTGTTNALNLTIPAQQNHQWQYNLGLGYELDNRANPTSGSDNSSALIAANNQAAINWGYVFQNYGEISSDEPGYLDRQAGQIMTMGITISKTGKNVLAKIAASEAIGNTRYLGETIEEHIPVINPTNNTMTDVSVRLGYQFIPMPVFSVTPYGVAGYHRWLRAIAGNPVNTRDGTLLASGYPETYHNTWTGLGALFQWAPLEKLVFSFDSNAGRTSNGQLHSWNTFFPPFTVSLRNNLGGRSYVMLGVGTDYEFRKKWHFLANVNYWRFNYGQSPADALGIFEPTSNTRLLFTTIGIGYALQ